MCTQYLKDKSCNYLLVYLYILFIKSLYSYILLLSNETFFFNENIISYFM